MTRLGRSAITTHTLTLIHRETGRRTKAHLHVERGDEGRPAGFGASAFLVGSELRSTIGVWAHLVDALLRAGISPDELPPAPDPCGLEGGWCEELGAEFATLYDAALAVLRGPQ